MNTASVSAGAEANLPICSQEVWQAETYDSESGSEIDDAGKSRIPLGSELKPEKTKETHEPTEQQARSSSESESTQSHQMPGRNRTARNAMPDVARRDTTSGPMRVPTNINADLFNLLDAVQKKKEAMAEFVSVCEEHVELQKLLVEQKHGQILERKRAGSVHTRNQRNECSDEPRGRHFQRENTVGLRHYSQAPRQRSKSRPKGKGLVMKNVCREYLTYGICSRRDSCHYDHPYVCKYWKENDSCKFGSECMFLHRHIGENKGRNKSPRSHRGDDHVQQYSDAGKRCASKPRQISYSQQNSRQHGY